MRIMVKSLFIGTALSVFGQAVKLSNYTILLMCAIAGGLLGVYEAKKNERDS
jgi:hypothetical protein